MPKVQERSKDQVVRFAKALEQHFLQTKTTSIATNQALASFGRIPKPKLSLARAGFHQFDVTGNAQILYKPQLGSKGKEMGSQEMNKENRIANQNYENLIAAIPPPPGRVNSFSWSPVKSDFYLIENMTQFNEKISSIMPAFSLVRPTIQLHGNTSPFMSIHVEFKFEPSESMADLPDISAIHIGLSDGQDCAYLFDCDNLNMEAVGQMLQKLFDRHVVICHDAAITNALLKYQLGVHFQDYRFIDVQLFYEDLFGDTFIDLISVCKLADSSLEESLNLVLNTRVNNGMSEKMRKNSYSAQIIKALYRFGVYLKTYCPEELSSWADFSTRLYKQVSLDNLSRKMCFNVEGHFELMSEVLFEGEDVEDTGVKPVEINLDLDDLCDILPKKITKFLKDQDLVHARDLVLDVGQRPRLFFHHDVIEMDNRDSIITHDQIASFCRNLTFGNDNRAILEKSLHRISAIRDRKNDINGLTVRFGRNITGMSSLFTDFLFSDCSILILGPPGTGKSSMIRDMARVLSSERRHVVVVDTSNELCGNGVTTHPSVGFARRMMVPHLDQQKSVMVEAVQNHTPDVLVIDEIGRHQEVEAAATIKHRGVRLIASAHGTFQQLAKNPSLKNLLGGFERVTVGDSMAKVRAETGERQKVIIQRVGEPVFDVVVELVKDENFGSALRIIHPVDSAVDSLLTGAPVRCQRRRFDSEPGFIRVNCENL